MNVHIVHDGKGAILSVNRTVDGLAHFIAGHGSVPTIAGGDEFGIESLNDAFSAKPIVRVSFSDADEVVIERHAVLV